MEESTLETENEIKNEAIPEKETNSQTVSAEKKPTKKQQ